MIAQITDHAVDHIGLAAWAIVFTLAAAVCGIYWTKRYYDDRRRH